MLLRDVSVKHFDFKTNAGISVNEVLYRMNLCDGVVMWKVVTL